MIIESASTTPGLGPTKENEGDPPVEQRTLSEPPPTIPRGNDGDQLMSDAPSS